ncbi:MAG: hypothetical protein GC189_10625 [Alphaproteobacteria bacterium]|nr:hypothetical protein [Alphaproteobacteria bacterium]
MTWKDVLAFVIDAETDAPAIRLSELVSNRFNAKRAIVLLTALPDEPLAYEPTVVAGVWAELLARARGQSDAERKKIEPLLDDAVTRCEMRTAEALSRDLGRVGAVHARYADVAILTRPVVGESGDLREELVEGVLFHAGRPALIAPPEWKGAMIGKRPLIAWDASREATRALADAAPLIEGADSVAVVTIDAKPKTFGHGEQPGANIAAHLNRRGLAVDVRNIDSMGRGTAQAILDEAEAVSADLIVMGGYAHSRLREMVFGGATRDLLRTAPMPILMAH